MNILMTAFEPFGGAKQNQSKRTVEAFKLDDPGMNITTMFLPVDYDDRTIVSLLENDDFDVIILTGEAAGRKKICFEHHAINTTFALAPDNKNITKKGVSIVDDGPLALKNTIGFMTMIDRLPGKHAVKLSFSAGAYLCNMNYYLALYHASVQNKKTKIGFIHVPVFDDDVANDKQINKNIALLKDLIEVLKKEQ